MSKVEKENGSIIHDQFGILNEIKLFYEKLYKKQEVTVLENFNTKLDQFCVPKLNKEESTSLDGSITKKEVYNFFKKMKNDKSPGPDGFTLNLFGMI